MYTSSKQRIVFIGSGKLATNMAKALSDVGHTILQVYSSTLAHAKRLAEGLNATYTDKAESVVTDADCYIIAVSDSAIESVLNTVNFENRLVVHASGSTNINIFHTKASKYGVFYPLQTFSREHCVSFARIPMLVEGSSPEVTAQLHTLAESISTRVAEMSSENRTKLHLSGVFACNFVNHLLAISDKLMEEAGLDFSLLGGLINETVEKALKAEHPAQMQTGPASRKDIIIINKHIAMLAAHPDWQELYQRLTDSIISHE